MDNTAKDAQYRRNRVARMKRLIIAIAFVLILIPIILCVVLFIRISKLENKIDMMMSYSQSAIMSEQKSGITDTDDNITTTEATLKASGSDVTTVVSDPQTPEKVSEKKVYLTFDDGPSDNTDAILDVLKKYNVKATFFVIEKTDQYSIEKYNRIIREGHTLAMHSSSHVYAKIYSCMDDYIQDVSELQNFLFQITGLRPSIYRFPGGSSNTVSKISMNDCVAYLNTAGITYFDWNIASGDATSGQITADTIVQNVISGVENENNAVVLMHDAKDKMTTVEALPGIIEKLIDMGAAVLPITDNTAPVHHKISK